MSKKVKSSFKSKDFQERTYPAKLDTERMKRKMHDVEFESEGVDDSESKHCSVASTRNFPAVGLLSNKNVFESQMEGDSHVDDSQSSHVFGKARKGGFWSEEEAAAQVHEVELYAYFSVLRALYASGPLSWDQEALLTNLRLSLNISNEEHLFQLRRLCSAGAL
eukprot:TRINITY_DN5108_c0_g1_i2.p1 TRINITY_DN5108_c0_g1~~TRINITY_DN5108_c0_g1_i2.p1  ORF type:complete len:164 (+),score=46.28 TRINITY_DN5108_c0_g1_i2:342-833(+)